MTDAHRGSVVAIFENVNDAENAIRELRQDGFSANRLGCATGDRNFDPNQVTPESRTENRHQAGDTHRSFWQKVENFFSGDEGYENRDTGSGDGSRQEGNVVDRTLTVPSSYNDRLSSGCTMVAVYGSDRLERAEQILLANDGEIQRNFEESQRGAGNQTGGRTIQLLSEVIRVNKERVNTGEARLHKEVRTEQQNIQVPVTREELVIERVPVEGRNATGNIGNNEEVRIPLSEERVQVEKRPVVREEVRVGKRQVEETRNVADQTRHEELKVDKTGKAKNEVDDLDERERRRRA
jgi:uncharacterized protein (TIGR02271 family)